MIKSITFRLKSSNHVGTIDMRGDVIPCHEVQAAIASKLSAPAEEVRVFMAGSTAPIHPQEDLPAFAVVDVVRQVASASPSFHSHLPGSNDSYNCAGGHAGSSLATSASSMSRGSMGRAGGRMRGRGAGMPMTAEISASMPNMHNRFGAPISAQRGNYKQNSYSSGCRSKYISDTYPRRGGGCGLGFSAGMPNAARGAAATMNSSNTAAWQHRTRGPTNAAPFLPDANIPVSSHTGNNPNNFHGSNRSDDTTQTADTAVHTNTSPLSSTLLLTAATEEERLAQLQAEVGWETGIDDVAASRRARRGGGWSRGGFYNPHHHSSNAPWSMSRGGYRGGLSSEDSFRPPPKGYVCHNCGKGGHLIQHCPSTRGGRGVKVISLPVGIPESMLVECTMDDPAPKFITRNNRLVKRRVDAEAFAQVATVQLSGQDEHRVYTSTMGSEPPMHFGTSNYTNDDTGSNDVGVTTDTDHVSIGDAPTTSASDDNNDSNKRKSAPTLTSHRYRCVMEDGLAREAMRLPCCARVMCYDCFMTMAESTMRRMAESDCLSGDVEAMAPPNCPSCGAVLVMDEVVPALEERTAIAQLRLMRKRAPSPHA